MKFTVTTDGHYADEIELFVVAFGTRFRLPSVEDNMVMTYVEIRQRNDGRTIIEFSAYGISGKTYHGHTLL